MRVEQSDRSERLLALLLIQAMKGASTGEKASQLSSAGFTNIEIADLLDTTAAVIGQRLHEGRKKKKKVR